MHQMAYRGGKEVPISENGKPTHATSRGLTSAGEFGLTLAIILSDAAKGQIVWSHWERTAQGVVGVFRFSVPAGLSHYAVIFCCASEGNDFLPGSKDSANSYRGLPPYHGSLYVDPATGAVRRYTLESEFKPEDPIRRSAIWVQYGEVTLGGSDYICPVRSGAIMVAQYRLSGIAKAVDVLSVNDVTFSGYHLFRSTMKILASPPE